MTKRRVYIFGFFCVLFLVGSFPVYVSWVCTRSIEGKVRAHYFRGLGYIYGAFGDEEAKSDLIRRSDLLQKNRVEVVIEFSSRVEMEALEEIDRELQIELLRLGGCVAEYDWGSHTITYEIDKRAKERFIEKMNTNIRDYRQRWR